MEEIKPIVTNLSLKVKITHFRFFFSDFVDYQISDAMIKNGVSIESEAEV